MLFTKISPCYESERGSQLFNRSTVVSMINRQVMLFETYLVTCHGDFRSSQILLPSPLHTIRDNGVGNASLLCQINPLPREPPVDMEMDPVSSRAPELLLEQHTCFLSLTLEPVSLVAHCDRLSAPQD